MLTVPYYKQLKDNWCGPACLQMVFAHYGKHISQEELAGKLHVAPEDYTHNKDMVRVTQDMGFNAMEKTNCAWEDIQQYVEKNIPSIVNFIEPSEGEGHFGVVTDMNKEGITINDPWNGEGFHMTKEDFLQRWKSGFEPTIAWLLVVSPK